MANFAVIVGINNYPNLEAPLNGAINDAKEFYKWLKDSDFKDDVNDENIVKIPENFDESLEIKHSEIIEQIENKIIDKLNKTPLENDRLYIFLSGHGVSLDTNMNLLLTSNARYDRMYHLPGDFCANWFKKAALFKEIILIMDCCRDYYANIKQLEMIWEEIKATELNQVKIFYAYATGWSKKAREANFGNKYMGIFTKTLIDALNGAAIDSEGKITSESIRNYLWNCETLNAQEPKFDIGTNKDYIIFKEGLTNKIIPVTITFTHPPTSISLSIADINSELETLQIIGNSCKVDLKSNVKYNLIYDGKIKIIDVLGLEPLTINL